MKKIISTLMAAVLLGVLLLTNNVASVPLIFTHQGRLLSASNQPVNGFFDIEYRIYADSTGGIPIWTEMHPNVEITNGFFDVEVGRIGNFFDIFTELSIDNNIWMEVQIEGSVTPISPRTRLAGSPYAMLADGVSSQHVFMSGGQLYNAVAGLGATDSSSELRIRVTPTSQTTGRVDVSAGTDGSRVAIGDITGDGRIDLITGDAVNGFGGQGGGFMRITGDPDFDLLRLTANADSAEIKMSGQVDGDPDFDLLRLIGRTKYANITMKVKNSIGNIRGTTTEVDSQTTRYHQWKQTGGFVKRMIELSSDSVGSVITVSNDPATKGLTLRADGNGGGIAINEEGVQKIKIDTDSTHAGIAVNEEGIQIAISADSGGAGSIAILAGVAIPKFMVTSVGNGYLSNSLKIGTSVGSNHIEVVGGANCDGTNWNNASDAASKENFQQIDGAEILEKLEELEITRWNYIGKNDAEHIGPTAQDFYKAFEVGGDDKTISTVDPSGIALAAIKELYKKSKEVDQLKKQLDELTKAVEKLAKERK